MEKHCGLLERVGDLTGGQIMRPTDSDGNQYVIGSYRAASVLDVVQIGGTAAKRNYRKALSSASTSFGTSSCRL